MEIGRRIVHNGTGQTQRMLWRQATFCVPTGKPPQHSDTAKRNTHLASKVLKTNNYYYWRFSWGDSKRGHYTAEHREKLGSFCSSFLIQKLHYLQMLPPALFLVFQKFWWPLSVSKFLCHIFFGDLSLWIHWPSHSFSHLFIPSVQQRYKELNIKHRILFRRYGKGENI